MATRERRLAEFNGNGEPPPDQPVQVLCEDHSGTYQLPFACRFIDGAWRNNDSGAIRSHSVPELKTGSLAVALWHSDQVQGRTRTPAAGRRQPTTVASTVPPESLLRHSPSMKRQANGSW